MNTVGQEWTQAVILGCGYVGRAVAQRWSGSLTVTATTTTPSRVAELATIADRVVIVNGNDADGLRSLLQDQDVLLLSIGAPNREAYETTYLQTAKTVVTVLPELPKLRQVIYTSSYAVYGDRGGDWVDETTPVVPVNRNSEILAESEQVLLNAAHDQLKICVLRLGGIYGPGREIVNIFRGIAGTTRPGSGAEASNWVHLEDIVGAIAFAQQHQLGGIYNLVGSKPLTVKTLLDRIFAAHNLPAVSWDAAQSSQRAYNAKVSNAKLRAAGYEFIYPEIPETV